MERVKILKRYANRRLYDSESSQTVTLDQVALFIKDGYEVQILDNISGEDITARVLGQTFLRMFADMGNPDFAVFLLSSLIREIASDPAAFLERYLQSGIVSKLGTRRLEAIARKMAELGQLDLKDRRNYIQELEEQIRVHSGSVDSRAVGGLDLMRDGLSGEKEARLGELSSRMEEMTRLLLSIKEEEE